MVLLTCNCLLHLFMNLIHTYNSFYSPLFALYTNIIILRKKVILLRQGVILLIQIRKINATITPKLILVLVAVILTFEKFLLIIKMLNAHKG